ncbi:MAG: hypothetical protein R3E89_17610 [Thiolinea sp.]
MLTDQLQPQVRLENRITARQEEQQALDDGLEQAKAALRRGDLTSADASGDNALNHLANLLFKQPGHAEGRQLLEDLIKQRQQQARQALEAGTGNRQPFISARPPG